MRRILSGGLLSAFVVLGSAYGANAVEVQRSGNTYYTAVCARTVGACGALPCAHRHRQNRPHPRIGAAADQRQDAGRSARCLQDHRHRQLVDDHRDRGCVRLRQCRSRSRCLSRAMGIPACTTANGCFKKLNQNGKQRNYPAQNIGWAQESALDLDMASAMCPNCKLWLVEANTNSFKNLGTAVDTAAALGAHVISNYYGGGEGEVRPEIRTLLRSSRRRDDGQHGRWRLWRSKPRPICRIVIAVGGTHLVADGSARGWTETVWRGAGSGCSRVFAEAGMADRLQLPEAHGGRRLRGCRSGDRRGRVWSQQRRRRHLACLRRHQRLRASDRRHLRHQWRHGE